MEKDVFDSSDNIIDRHMMECIEFVKQNIQYKKGSRKLPVILPIEWPTHTHETEKE